MPKLNVNLADAASLIFKAKGSIHGPFKGMTDQIIEQDIKLPLVKLFEVVDLQNQALEKLHQYLQGVDPSLVRHK